MKQVLTDTRERKRERQRVGFCVVYFLFFFFLFFYLYIPKARPNKSRNRFAKSKREKIVFFQISIDNQAKKSIRNRDFFLFEVHMSHSLKSV